MPQGFLAVSSQPSSRLPIEEFNEWYEEEHIPLRLNHLKEFLSGARYKVVSSRESEDRSDDEASWLALYTVVSPVVFSSSSYQDLRINRSDREKDVMNRIEVLTRITGEIIGTYGPGEEKTIGFNPGRPSGCVITHGINTQDVDKDNAGDRISSWARQIEQEVAKYRDIEDGWARTLLVLVLESGVSRFGKNIEAGDKTRMPYYVVHGGFDSDLQLSCYGH